MTGVMVILLLVAYSEHMARPASFGLRVLPSPVAARNAAERASIEVYKPFFVAGIITVLTAGCLLGSLALMGISRAASYTASAWTPYVLAHANSQLFGWVGFFVMGFAMQQHPPSVSKLRQFTIFSWSALCLMALGIGLRFAAEPLAASGERIGVVLGVIACCLQLLAVMAFVVNMTWARYRPDPPSPMPWQSYFVFASLFWLLVVSIAEPFMFLGSHQADRAASVQFVAEWFTPLRETQFLGFVAMMIFGVSLTKFSTCFEFRAANRAVGLWGLATWTIGLLLRIVGWIADEAGVGQFLYANAGAAMLAIGVFLIVSATNVLAKVDSYLPVQKFLRASYAWLLIAGVMMLVEPLVLQAAGTTFSHAFTGAIRHAVTVGFISQMILGVGAHVVSRMTGVPLTNSVLMPAFLFLNIGNSIRVGSEVATVFTPGAFGPMGWTGFVELVALAFWAGGIQRSFAIASRRERAQHAA